MLFILQVFIPRCKVTIFFHTCKSFLIKLKKNGQVVNRIRRRIELENGSIARSYRKKIRDIVKRDVRVGKQYLFTGDNDSVPQNSVPQFCSRGYT